MVKNSYKKYSSAWSAIRRHWRTSVSYLSFGKIVNIIRLKIEEFLGRDIVKGKPYFIKIEPTNKCNLMCEGCIHAASNRSLEKSGYLGDMDFELFKKIIDSLSAWLVKVSLYSEGEPLIYPKIIEMIKYLNQNKIGSVISSNLNYCPPDLIRGMVENKLTHLIVCLDGYNKETYSKYRKGGDFSKVINNIKAIQEEKRRQNSKFPFIEIQAINFSYWTKDELDKIEKMAKELKADSFLVKDDLSVHYKNPKPVKKKCFWLYGHPQFHWNGTVQPCCYFYDKKNNNFGNVNDNNFFNIWNNEKYINARRYFSGKKAKEMDLMCYNCIFFKK